MTDLIMWTIYDHPSDYPNVYVAREWCILPSGHQPTGNVIRCAVLEPLREQMRNAGRICLDRDERDDPVIVESWI